jgi:hypothetical protein
MDWINILYLVCLRAMLRALPAQRMNWSRCFGHMTVSSQIGCSFHCRGIKLGRLEALLERNGANLTIHLWLLFKECSVWHQSNVHVVSCG